MTNENRFLGDHIKQGGGPFIVPGSMGVYYVVVGEKSNGDIVAERFNRGSDATLDLISFKKDIIVSEYDRTKKSVFQNLYPPERFNTPYLILSKSGFYSRKDADSVATSLRIGVLESIYEGDMLIRVIYHTTQTTWQRIESK